jgi:hypothetical protein
VGRDVARSRPPAPLAEGAQTGCPIADAPAGSRAPKGSAPIACLQLTPPKRDLTREPRARGAPSCLATMPHARPRSASLPLRAVVAHGRRRPPESNRARVGRTAPFRRLHRASHRRRLRPSPATAPRGASFWRAPRRDASKGNVRAQLVKEHPGIPPKIDANPSTTASDPISPPAPELTHGCGWPRGPRAVARWPKPCADRSRRALEHAYGYAEARATRLRTPIVARRRSLAARSEPSMPGACRDRRRSDRANGQGGGEI